MENQTSNQKSWSNSFLDSYKTFGAQYALEMLHSLGSSFDNKYVMNESLQTMMIDLANKDDKCFYKLALNAYHSLQKNESLDLMTIFNEDEFEYNKHDLFKFDEEKQEKDDLYYDVNVVHVTPSCMKVMPRERTQGHRVLRHRIFTDVDEFCLVYFKPDKVGEYINQCRSYAMVLKSGIRICNIHYHFFGASNSQLREHSYWFVRAKSHEEIDQKRRQLGDFSKITNIGKYVARLGLWFSKSIPTGITLTYTEDFDRRVQNGEYCVTKIDDIERNGYCFTDGNGFISKGLARIVAKKLGCRIKTLNHDIYPSAYQIRMAGCKGLVVVEPQSTLEQFYIKFRESMRKFDSDDWSLDICETSQPIPTRLNNQIIIIMSDLGVPDETFLRLQRKWFDDKERPPNITEHLLKNKLPLPVNECRYMFGCAFESGLEPGQCFIRYQIVDDDGKPLKEPRFETVVGRVIVTKNPCPYAGDMIVLEAVDCPELNCLTDVIVFSTKDERPDPNKIAGSDLDGDHYFVYWGQDLQLSRKVEPLDYTSFAAKVPSNSSPITNVNITNHCYSLLGATSYGEIYNLHANVVEKNLENCEQRTCQKIAIELATMFSAAIDSAKTGYVINRKRLSQIRKTYGTIYPDFLMKNNSYESQSIVGKLYRQAIEYRNANPERFRNQDMDLHANTYNNFRMKNIYSYVEIRTALNIDPHIIYQELKYFCGDKVPDESKIAKCVAIYKKKNEHIEQSIESSGHSYIPPKNTDLTGQTIIVTGAASGIGRVSAIDFAKLGAKVIVGIRGQSRAEKIAQLLEHEAHIIGTGRIIGYDLDLSKLSIVKKFADKILEHEQHVNILLNNAGTVQLVHSVTFDELETQFGINHIGHFYLTKLLLPLLIQSKARIVNVSSLGHCFVDDHINYEFPSSSYNVQIAYGQSKLAQIWHAYELQQRYGQQGINAYSLHPGMIFTGITRRAPKLFDFVYQLVLVIVGKSLSEGAQTSLYCSLSNQAKPGKFHGNCKEAKTSPLAYNKKLAEECWEFSERIVNEKTKHF
ncbi:unnamed protein product [Rotaria sp. Silwood1]|nr:unnamed protein product [Rotaria sp. Silwood1]